MELNKLPATGRIAAIDFGTVRLGIAITDPEQKLSSPLENRPRSSTSLEEKFFRQLVGQEKICGFVVGLPLHLDGGTSRISQMATEFANWLKTVTGVPVILFDERFTSHAAEELIAEAKLTSKKRKALLDKLAAHVLLCTYLETRRDDRRGLE